MILPATYLNGFAPRDGQPLYPSLWTGCCGAWNPGLGPTGAVLQDWSGRRRDMTLSNMTLDTAWSVNGGVMSLGFDGLNDVGEGASPSELVNATKATVSGWFRRTTTSTLAGFFGIGVSGSESSRFVVQPWSDGLVYVSLGSAQYGYFASNDVAWHNVVAVYDGTQSTNATKLRVWFDGVEVALTFTGTLPATLGSPTTVRVGRTHNVANQYGSGAVNDVRIYDQLLSVTQIRQLRTRRGIAYEMVPRRRSSAQVTVAPLRYNLFSGSIGNTDVIGAS